MLDLVMATALEDVQRAGDVAVDVGVRILDGVADARLSAEMNHPIKPFVGEQRLHACSVGQVEACQGEIRESVQDRRPGFLERDLVVVVEIVQPNNGVAPLKQALGGEHADEAGRPRYQDLHA